MKKPYFALVPSGYRLNKIYSILPVDGSGDLTFARASESTRVAENGLIQYTAIGLPTMDWLNSSCPSLLLEPQRTNYAINSSDASLWANVGGSQSITKTQNFSVSPTGEKNATRLEANATGNNYSLIQLSTTSITGNYTGSVYLKSNTQNIQNIIVYGRNTAVNSYEIGNEWRRIDLQGSGTTGQNLFLFIGSFPSNGSDEIIDISVWGGQLELGDFASSYIPTTNLIATRSADLVSPKTLDINNVRGSVFLDLKASDVGYLSYIKLKGAPYDRIDLVFDSSERLSINIGNGTAPPFYSYQYIHNQERFRFAVRWNNGTYSVFINGVNVSNFTTSSVFSSLNQLAFDNSLGYYNFVGDVYEVGIYNENLTNAEIITLTTL